MHALTICTGWSPAGFEQYGRYFVDTFVRRAAADIRLLCYVEKQVPGLPARVEQIDLWQACEGLAAFIERNRDNPARTGRQPNGSWKDGERAAGYSFRWDAVKFCRQGYIPLHAAGLTQTPLLAWFDADVVFTAPVRAEQITSLLPADKHIAYLGRPPKFSEIGFQLYRLPEARAHLREFRDLYDSDRVFDLEQTHSAFVFDRAREASQVPAHNLTPTGKGNVWPTSRLAAFSVHLKGERKSQAAKLAR